MKSDDNISEAKANKRQKLEFWRKRKVLVPCVMLVVMLVVAGVSFWGYKDYEKELQLDAESVILKEDRKIEVGTVKHVTDFLDELNGTLVEDLEITADEIGDTEVSFEYYNIEDKKRTIRFKVKAIDTVAPKIYGGSSYTVNVGYEGDLTDLMLSGDDVDDNPRREITGSYDIEKVGKYSLEYVVTDASGNTAKQPFTLSVVRPSTAQAPAETSKEIKLEDIIDEYKADDTDIGIDVSQWQGEIDWQDVKDAGVEFAFIRIGYQTEFGGKYVLDPYYEENIQGATAVGLLVGVYFYSYADSVQEAARQAVWVVQNLEDYPVELGVAFDWESWGEFNQAGMSFRKINKVAETFLGILENYGYKGLLYSSKTYLDRIWTNTKYETWLAQYYDYVTYDGDYTYWQMANTGRVDGIYGDVDINIRYKNR